MAKYEEQICEAIETIVNSKIASANFDKTIQATVIECTNAATAEYKVSYQDSKFYAYATNVDITYTKDTQVYVLIPGNDFSRPKTILGTIKNLGIENTNVIEEEDLYDVVGKDIISSNSSIINLCSYDDYTQILLFDIDNNINLINVNNEDAKEYFTKSSALKASAYFRTALPIEQRYNGNYGIVFELEFIIDGATFTREYIFDINNMKGTPYQYTVKSRQYYIFNLNNAKNFNKIKKIWVFQENFPNTRDGEPLDIFIDNIQLTGVIERAESSESTILSFITSEGTYFSAADDDNTTKTIQAELRVKNRVINNTNSQIKFYWFKEDIDITSNSKYYNIYGGSGWKCINNGYETSDSTMQWDTTQDIVNIKKSDMTAQKVSFKCVALYGDNTQVENEITFSNYSANYDISIEQSQDYKTSLINLTCLINGEDNKIENLTYKWTRIDGSTYTNLDETTTINNTYNNAAVAYEQLAQDIKDGKVLASIGQIQLKTYSDIMEQYATTMRVEGNKIYNINPNTINSYTSFKCSVYGINESYIGTATIVPSIRSDTDEANINYNLFIYDAQHFKYNKAGLKPKQEITPLTFTLYENSGAAVDINNILNAGTIQWAIPKNSMITVPSNYIMALEDDDYKYYRNLTNFNFGIRNIFNENYNDNTIELNITYNGKVTKERITMDFTKEGAVARETKYDIQIIPNSDEYNGIPIVLNNSLNYTPINANVWFRVCFIKDGIKIYNDFTSGITTEGKEIELEWSILNNAGITSLSIHKVTGVITYSGYNNSNPVNIIDCKIVYEGKVYHRYIPIVTAFTNDNNYEIYLKNNTGFQSVVYNSNGRFPMYNRTNPFELLITQNINGTKEDISELTISDYKVDIEWSAISNYLIIDNSRKIELKNNQQDVIADTWLDTNVFNSAVKAIVRQGENIIGEIHIPIYLFKKKVSINHDFCLYDENEDILVSLDPSDGFDINAAVNINSLTVGKKEIAMKEELDSQTEKINSLNQIINEQNEQINNLSELISQLQEEIDKLKSSEENEGG